MVTPEAKRRGWTEAHVVKKKEWVGLTKEERKDIFDLCERDDRGYVAAMVEAKLKEKIGG